MTSNADKRKTCVALHKLEGFEQPPVVSGPQGEASKQGGSFWDRTIPRADTATRSKRRRIASPRKDDGRAAPLELYLPKVAAAGMRAYEYVGTKYESPWKSFRRVYELKFDEYTTVAIRKASPCEVVTVQGFPGPDGSEKLDRLQKIHHKNFVALLESFHHQEQVYAILEHVSISLAQIVASPPYPTELQLAAILGQILDGLAYLSSQGMAHGALACSNVLLNTQGIIKIAKQEHCMELSSLKYGSHDLRAVGSITMELMQKFTKEDGAVGVEDLDRWPSDSRAVGFLSDTTSTPSVHELIKHPLIRSPWRPEELKWMVELAGISVHRGYKL